MKTETEILMDYQKAMHQADTIRRISAVIRNVSGTQLQNCISILQTNWKGNNAQAYIGKCKKWKTDVDATSLELEQTSEMLCQIAERTYSAEMRALEIQRLRHK